MFLKTTINIIFFFFAIQAYSQNAIEITNKMFEKVKKVKSISFQVIAKERFNERYVTQKAFIKRQENPLRIYYKQLIPKTDAEVLINATYIKKALVNPNSFPWTNLSLDPYGSILRDTQHHNLYNSGFHYLVNILSLLTDKYKDHLGEMNNFKGIVDYLGVSCYKIEFQNPYFKFYSYTTIDNTSPALLAKKFNIGDYLIVERNPSYKNYNDLIKKGTVVNLPNDYAKRLVLLIDKSTFLPVYIEIHDDKGLLEQYQFTEVNINPGFTEYDFSEKNENYGFK